MARWVKDLVLSLLWLGSLLWRGFNSWPGNFCMPWAWRGGGRAQTNMYISKPHPRKQKESRKKEIFPYKSMKTGRRST